jgi:hypothetical protein
MERRAGGKPGLFPLVLVESLAREDRQVPCVSRNQESDLVDLEGVGDPLDEAGGEVIEIELSVQVAREREERAPVVVSLAVERRSIHPIRL